MKVFKVMELFCMPEECVYALVHHENKRFMVGYSKHLLTALSRIRHDLETPKYEIVKNDIEGIEVEILETDLVDDVSKKIKVQHHVQKYLDKGYQQYIPSNVIKYEVCTDILTDRYRSYFCIYLQDRKKNKVLVGVFRSMVEMKSFSDKYYPNNTVEYGIHYATNDTTKNYFKRNGIVYK